MPQSIFKKHGLENREYGRRDPSRWHPLSTKVGANFTDKWGLLGWYSPLTVSGHRVQFLGIYFMAPEPSSTAYFINPSHQSVCLNVHPLIIIRQGFNKNVTVAAITQELLAASVSMLSMSHQRKISN
jgi:hypothetical protein